MKLSYQNKTDLQINRHEIVGITRIIPDFYSTHLKNERDIIVWFPPSYNDSFKSYPVVYMHDGQNLFNPQTSFIGFDWKVDETVIRLIETGKMEEVIIVGIYNTKNRMEEYNLFQNKGMNYANFIIKELKPYIDENFRTLSRVENTATIGSSMGGLCAFQLLWNFPHVFGKAAALSSSFWVDNKKILNLIESDKNPVRDIKIYLDCGSLEKELIADTKKMILLLHNKGYREEKNMKSHIEKGGIHSEVDWAKRLEIPLKFLFGKSSVFF